MPVKDTNADLQQLDDLLFDILKQDDKPRAQGPPRPSNADADFVNPYQNQLPDNAKNPILD